MFTTSFIRTVSLAGLIFASNTFAFDWIVGVGKDENTGKKGLGFDPSVISPAIGDTIVWQFRSGAHSVVESTFEKPCTASGQYTTGVQTVDDALAVDAGGLPEVRLLVNSTDSLWFFDDAGGLCSQGAVIAINPSGTQTAAAFKANAATDTNTDTNAGTTTPAQTSTTGGSTISSSSTSSSTTSTTPATGNSAASLRVPGLLLLLGAVIVII